MNFKESFRRMVEGLENNPNVRLIEVAFADPAADAEIEQARRLAGGSLPAGVEDFYREMNGFGLQWEHTVEPIKQRTDADRGFINLLPVARVFGDWEGSTWFEGFEGGDKYKPVKPLDQFVPEACAAFFQESGRATDRDHLVGQSDDA